MSEHTTAIIHDGDCDDDACASARTDCCRRMVARCLRTGASEGVFCIACIDQQRMDVTGRWPDGTTGEHKQ